MWNTFAMHELIVGGIPRGGALTLSPLHANEKALTWPWGQEHKTKAFDHKKIRKFSGDASSVVLATGASLERASTS